MSPSDGPSTNRPLLPRGLIVYRLDVIALGRGQIGLWTGSRIGREGVGERSGLRLPNAALDAVLSGQGQVDGGLQVGAKLWIRKPGRRPAPCRLVCAVTVANEVARMGDRPPPRGRPGRWSTAGRADRATARLRRTRGARAPRGREGGAGGRSCSCAFRLRRQGQVCARLLDRPGFAHEGGAEDEPAHGDRREV